MKFLIILYFTISTSFAFYHNSFPVENNKFNQYTKDNYFFEPTILILPPLKRPSIPEMDYFKSKLINYSLDYEKDANQRNRQRPNPIKKFAFVFQKHHKVDLSGYCFYDENIIYIKMEHFNKSLFYHELGHCDLGYSHVSDYHNIVKKGYSDKIMHWSYNYQEPRNQDLDVFFNVYNNKKFNSYLGNINHEQMMKEVKIREKNSSKGKK